MAKVRVIHRYMKYDVGVRKSVPTYKCGDEGCPHYMPAHMLGETLESKCWNCDRPMIINTRINERIRPVCDECIEEEKGNRVDTTPTPEQVKTMFYGDMAESDSVSESISENKPKRPLRETVTPQDVGDAIDFLLDRGRKGKR